jgi:hypothetical protein
MPSKKQEPELNQPPPPTHWRVTEAGEAAGIGWPAGTVVPAVDLAPQTGAMHERKLIAPATDREIAAVERAADAPPEPPASEPAKE